MDWGWGLPAGSTTSLGMSVRTSTSPASATSPVINSVRPGSPERPSSSVRLPRITSPSTSSTVRSSSEAMLMASDSVTKVLPSPGRELVTITRLRRGAGLGVSPNALTRSGRLMSRHSSASWPVVSAGVRMPALCRRARSRVTSRERRGASTVGGSSMERTAAEAAARAA